MFGKVMSWTDGMIANGFELCTTLPMAEIKKMQAEIQNPRDLKLKLAFEIVKTFLGEKSAKVAEAHFQQVFQEKAKPQDIPELKPSALDIITVLVEAAICKSKSEARQVISQGGVKINKKKVLEKNEQYWKNEVCVDG